MKKFKLSYALAALLTVGSIVPATAQQTIFFQRPAYLRPYDKSGLNVFETSKTPDSLPFKGLRISLGAGFTQQFQNLKAENTASNNGGTTVLTAGTNKLYPLRPGFMTSQANLFLDVQLADGIRLNVTTYLSARRHNETWVKGGYIQFDKLPFKGQFWNDLMKITTIKVGHYEVNYGDAHFRRPDGGQTLQSPFMEGNIMDAFTTEIGGEVAVQKNGFFGVVGLTNGMLKGNIDTVLQSKASDGTIIDGNTRRSPSIILKGGYDKQLSEDVRVRLSGSFYHNSSSAASGLTLYSGDRTGSNYQNVVEKWVANGTAQAYTAIPVSGRFNPNFTKKVDAVMLNGFLKVKGLEFFGTAERAEGRTKTEKATRLAFQYAGEAIYRFGKNENLYIGGRYNTVKAELTGFANPVTVDRTAAAAGWFLTPSVLLKGEYVIQNYKDFPITDYRNGGKFNGYVIEAVVGF